MPSPVILARTNIAYQRPAWENLRIDPQAPEAQNLYAAGAVPPGRTPAQLNGIILPNADKTPYQWPITYAAPLGSAGDSIVGSYAKVSGTSTKYTITLAAAPPLTTQGTLAVWMRRRGALTAGNQVASLPSVGLTVGADASTPIVFIWNNASTATITGIIPPLDEWALVVGTHKDGFSTTYIFAPGIDLSSGPYADTTTSRRIGTVAAGGTGATSTGADYADVAFWARAFTANEVRALWDPATRWRRYYVPKTYWQLGDTPVADTQPLAAQPPRPRYLRLNTFSPQSFGLYAWVAAVDGTLTQVATPAVNNNSGGGFPTNLPNRVWIQSTASLTRPDSPAPQRGSDFGVVAQSFRDYPFPDLHYQRSYLGNLDLTDLTDLTVVYWICPLRSNETDAGYWTVQNFDLGMTNAFVQFTNGGGLQTLSFAQDPHISGRWQMIAVSRTLAGITVWRDQEVVASGAVTGTALGRNSNSLYAQIGCYSDSVLPDSTVNALWADFRVYNRAWNQGDVNYAYNPATRWDYYYKPKTTPYEDIPIGPPPSSGFLSRLALMGAG